MRNKITNNILQIKTKAKKVYKKIKNLPKRLKIILAVFLAFFLSLMTFFTNETLAFYQYESYLDHDPLPI
ncbi:MAG: hypothetical protein ABFQ62_01525 [Patescibacteria group bacterium]